MQAETQGQGTWPPPEVPRPDMEDLERMIYDGVAEATDGCTVEPDGVCSHGHPSWLLVFGIL